jgi:hypothetical protein
VCGTIDATSQAAEDHHSTGCQVARESLGHADPAGRWVPRTNDGDSRAVQYFRIPAKIKDQRRVVNLLESIGIVRVVKRDDLNAQAACLGHFFMREFQRLARADRLRGDGR